MKKNKKQLKVWIGAAMMLFTLEPLSMVKAQTNDVLVPDPTIIIEESPDIPEVPSTLPSAVPPRLPRAVAPPVGDMAVSNIDPSVNGINLGATPIIPRLVLQEAPVTKVLELLARQANLNIVIGDVEGESVRQTISLNLENQSLQDVFNSVLAISGLSANRIGNVIYVGSQLPDGVRNLLSRTIRLNQVEAESAATFLASQGAEVQQVVIPIEEITDPQTNRVVSRIEQAPELRPLTATQPEGSLAPLLLSGLKVATDDRLNSITLVGEPRQIEIATSFLIQLDARRRQVAVNVKIIDVNLNNIDDFNSSFSFGWDDGFFVQDGGEAILNFGGANPPTASDARGTGIFPVVTPFENIISGDAEISPFLDTQLDAPFGEFSTPPNLPGAYARPGFGTFDNPFQPGVSSIDENEITYSLPNLYQYPQDFLITLEAQVQSGNAKILTDPTLVVQEGQGAAVQLTQEVVTSINTEVDPLSGVRTITPEIGEAGLILGVDIARIDDNGYITFIVNPVVSSLGGTQQFNSGDGSVNTITLLNTRSLNSGLIRLRDGQTLIVSGIIQESDRTTVSKVPLLGDIPLLGALFRSTSKTTDRREVIIVLTPKIIDDNTGFGYNYVPGQEAQEMLEDSGFSIPSVPPTP